MHRKTVLGGHLRQCPHLLRWGDRPSCPVMGVFQADQAGGREVDIFGADVLFHPFRVQHTVLALNQNGDQPSQGRQTSHLEGEDVRPGFHNHFGAPLAVGEQGGQVALGAAGDKQTGFHAHLLGHHLFQADNRRILYINIVPDLRLIHRLAHGIAGLGNGIAAQIYYSVHLILNPLCTDTRGLSPRVIFSRLLRCAGAGPAWAWRRLGGRVPCRL